jgi:sulfate adenylyltransferase
MSHLVPVHGGLTALVNRIVSNEEKAAFSTHAEGLSNKLELSVADKSTFQRIADGALSPLVGPMNETVYRCVLENSTINSMGKDYAWTIPLAFPMTDEEQQSIKSGDEVAVYSQDVLLGTLSVESVYAWEKSTYNESVYGTDRTDHPGAKIVDNDERNWLCGGTIRSLPWSPHPGYGQFEMSPAETRVFFEESRFERAVAFQTRNPLHRAHEYALVYGAEQLTGAGHYTGVVLNPLVGETKSDDVDAVTRMQTYANLVSKKLLGQGDKNDALWETAGHELNKVFHLLALDMKMFYAGPKEAVMHAIYRQNYGFTHIIIGRKHADAPYDDGGAIWGDFDAHEIFDALPGALTINALKVGFAAYYESIGRVDLMSKHPDEKAYFVSGKDVRKSLQAGERPDARIMRPETADILISAMQNR